LVRQCHALGLFCGQAIARAINTAHSAPHNLAGHNGRQGKTAGKRQAAGHNGQAIAAGGRVLGGRQGRRSGKASRQA